MAGSATDNQRRTGPIQALGLRALALAAAAIGMMLIDHNRNDLDGLRSGLMVLTYPLQVIVSLPSRFVDWTASNTVSRADLERENNSLRIERLRTLAELQRFNDLEAENARLRSMLNATRRVRDEFSMAEIMAVDANPYRHTVVINKGTRRGVYQGQALVDAAGVLGQVDEPGPFSSSAILISDPDHALPVEIVRNGLRTIAEGTGDYDRLVLRYLPNNADVEIGDELVTSGLGGAFPNGYPVATVSAIELRPGQPFALIEATPAAELNQVREVVLIRTGQAVPDLGAGAEPAPGGADATEPADGEG